MQVGLQGAVLKASLPGMFGLATYRLMAARNGLLGDRECETLIDGCEMQHR